MAGPAASTQQPTLSALQVTGGVGFYPAFDPAVLHYAVRCADATVLQVAAAAEEEDATLRLRNDGSTATGSVEASVTVDEGHDVAIDVSDRRGTGHLRRALHPAGLS